MKFRDEWDLDTALKILQNKTVDSKLWAEAVEWLLVYGPPELVSLLLEASAHATDNSFPKLRPATYTHDGQPCYDIKEVARSLGITEEAAREIIAEKERMHETTRFFDDTSSGTVH